MFFLGGVGLGRGGDETFPKFDESFAESLALSPPKGDINNFLFSTKACILIYLYPVSIEFLHILLFINTVNIREGSGCLQSLT